jgi:hypothetical protein
LLKFEVMGAFPPASRPGSEAFVDVQNIGLLAVLQKESLDYRPTDPLFAVGFLAFSHVFERLRPKPANKAIPTEMGAPEAGLWQAERLCRLKSIGPVKFQLALRICDRRPVRLERDFEKRSLDSRALASEGVSGVTDTEDFRCNFPGGLASPTPPDCEIHNPPIPGEHRNFRGPS